MPNTLFGSWGFNSESLQASNAIFHKTINGKNFLDPGKKNKSQRK